MGRFTKIEWAKHTYNLWWGCVHLSPACDNCYADTWAKFALPPGWLIVGEGATELRRTKHRDPDRPQIWGADAPRIFPPENSPALAEPLKWNRDAAAVGERHRVFTCSMCDICERHRSPEVNVMMNQRRATFFTEIVPACPNLDFLLVTKRPHDIMRFVPTAWHTNWPTNVWVGTTVEDQQRAAQRLPHLVAIPAPVRFISAEPLLGPLDLAPWITKLDWVIGGGESGAGARPTEIEWMRSLRDQVTSTGTAFHFKQWGHWAQVDGDGSQIVRLRTKSFRILDGRTWDELPTPRTQQA